MVLFCGLVYGLFLVWLVDQKPFELLDAAAEGEEKECFHPAWKGRLDGGSFFTKNCRGAD